jgi:hypothetical protein
MKLESSLETAPKLSYGVYFEIYDTFTQVSYISHRIRTLFTRLSLLTKEIQSTNNRLILQTAPFPTLLYDDKLLYINPEHKQQNFMCFSKACTPQGKNKKDKNCIIIWLKWSLGLYEDKLVN